MPPKDPYARSEGVIEGGIPGSERGRPRVIKSREFKQSQRLTSLILSTQQISRGLLSRGLLSPQVPLPFSHTRNRIISPCQYYIDAKW